MTELMPKDGKMERIGMTLFFTLILGVVIFFKENKYFKYIDGKSIEISDAEKAEIFKEYKKYQKLYNTYLNTKDYEEKCKLLSSKDIEKIAQLFIFIYTNDVIKASEKSKIPASVIMSILMHESGLGSSNLALKSNNLPCIKCFKHSSAEFLGKDIDACCVSHFDNTEEDHFFSYSKPEEAIVDLTKLLLGEGGIKTKESNWRKRNYAECFKCSNDTKCWAQELEKAGYATGGGYAKSLLYYIGKYDLEKLDKNQTFYLNKEEETFE